MSAGWIEWKGGARPVKPKTKVHVLLHNGNMLEMLADQYDWDHNGSGTDIVAYRRC